MHNKDFHSTRAELDKSEVGSLHSIDQKGANPLLGKRPNIEYEGHRFTNLDSPTHSPYDIYLKPPSYKMLKQASNQSSQIASQVPSPAPEPNDTHIQHDREGFSALADFISDSHKDDNQSFKFEDE